MTEGVEHAACPPPLPFAWVLIGSTLSDALVAGVLLAYPRARASTASGAPIGMGRIVFVAAATTLFFVAKLPLLTASGVHPFGLMHLVYLDLVGVIPAVGLSLLAAARLAAAPGFRAVDLAPRPRRGPGQPGPARRRVLCHVLGAVSTPVSSGRASPSRRGETAAARSGSACSPTSRRIA